MSNTYKGDFIALFASWKRSLNDHFIGKSADYIAVLETVNEEGAKKTVEMYINNCGPVEKVSEYFHGFTSWRDEDAPDGIAPGIYILKKEKFLKNKAPRAKRPLPGVTARPRKRLLTGRGSRGTSPVQQADVPVPRAGASEDDDCMKLLLVAWN